MHTPPKRTWKQFALFDALPGLVAAVISISLFTWLNIGGNPALSAWPYRLAKAILFVLLWRLFRRMLRRFDPQPTPPAPPPDHYTAVQAESPANGPAPKV